MGGNKKTSGSKPAQVTVMLRLIAGGYLVYLAYGLFKEYMKPDAGAIYQLGFALLFLAIGACLAGWSIMKFSKGDYVKYGESPDDDETLEHDETKKD